MMDASRADDELSLPRVRPAARVRPLTLSLASLLKNPLRLVPQSAFEGSIVTDGRRRPRIVWVTGPELLEQVLIKHSDVFVRTDHDRRVLKPIVGYGVLTADGDHWRWQRKLAAPLFRPSDVAQYVPVMTKAAHEQLAAWRSRPKSSDGTAVCSIEDDMTETTFAVIARTILAGVEEQEATEIRRGGQDFVKDVTWSVAAALLRLPEGFWHPRKTKIHRAAFVARAAIKRLIDKRRAFAPEGDDLVSRMLRARDPDTGEPMTDEQLVDNLATFLLAGHETTAKALTWTLYILGRAPDWQQRIRDEVERVAPHRDLTHADIANLAVTHRVLKEAMRLYPPAPTLTRVNRKPVELGGMHFSAQTLFVVPVYAVHRHHALWENPDTFDPDRFLPEFEARHKRCQFLPFGAGPRICIGGSFAMMEATVILATLVRHAVFEWDGTHEPEPVGRFTLHPAGGMPLLVRMLSGSPGHYGTLP